MSTTDPTAMIQDPEIAALYEQAPRFDEGELFLSSFYHKTKGEQFKFRDLLLATFGQGVAPLLEEYTATLFDEMECEAQHYFQEGYRAAKRTMEQSH